MSAVSKGGESTVRRRRFVFLAVPLLCFVSASSYGRALDADSLAKKIEPSVMRILERSPSGTAVPAGSGFLVSADGKLVTNDHGSKRAEELAAQAADGRVYRVVSILARDAREDRELLQLAAKDLPFLSISSPLSVREGETVAIVPNRWAGQDRISFGTVSLVRGSSGKKFPFAVSGAVPRLHAGAPVIGAEGRVLGVATARVLRAGSGKMVVAVAPIGKVVVLPGGGVADQVESPSGGAVAEKPNRNPMADLWKPLRSSAAGENAVNSASADPGSRERGGEEEAAWGLLRSGRYGKAAEAFEEALHRKSSDARNWLGFGLAKRGLGQTEEAATIFRQALRLDRSSREAWRELGEVDLRLGRYGEAADSFGRAVRLGPQDARAWLGVAEAAAALKKRQEASAALDQVRDLAPADGEIWQAAGKVYLQLGKREEAAMAFQRAADCNPEDPRAWLELGLLSVELKRTERAEEILPKLLELDREMGMKLVEALEKR
ncbi:TPR repeat-containing protein YrrB [Methylacidimicrobium cyclopophantes]|uniref:TPR repeat-containing protein YrrB n=1 Tax=Methylacidimicrobium cyclopophantes TaxID=1041766 RepID=A0A5E6MBP7_9BACT|nr:tetratricopeptide repeat-containing serine protease family protein [Methylacidimicrobium cyclopophantes]VVM06952.1 TPR repeat-containing protein YrrB [Methylacidimicrobium cyclopophantes]